ncbi:MAG: phage tail protein [Chloroflexota bacterium]
MAGGTDGTTTESSVREWDPFLSFNFAVELQGSYLDGVGFFTEVSGIGSESGVIEYKTVNNGFYLGGQPLLFMIPGRPTWGPITLKRGLTTDTDFWAWREMVNTGWKDPRSTLTITMFSRDYQPAFVWQARNAWPSKITGPTLSAETNGFAVEELTIVHEGLQVVQPEVKGGNQSFWDILEGAVNRILFS